MADRDLGWDLDSCDAALERVEAALRLHGAAAAAEDERPQAESAWRLHDVFFEAVAAALHRVGRKPLCAVPHPLAAQRQVVVVLEADRHTVSTWALDDGTGPVLLDSVCVAKRFGITAVALTVTRAAPSTLFLLDARGALWLLAPFVPRGLAAPAPECTLAPYGPFCPAFVAGGVRTAALAVVSCAPLTVVTLCNGRVLRTLVSLSPLPGTNSSSSEDAPMVVTEMDRVDDIAAGLDENEDGRDSTRVFALARAGTERGCAVLASARGVLAVRADYVPDYATHGTASRFVAAPQPLRITRVYAAPAEHAIAAVADRTRTSATLTVTLTSGEQHSASLPCPNSLSSSERGAVPATPAALEAAAAQLSTDAGAAHSVSINDDPGDGDASRSMKFLSTGALMLGGAALLSLGTFTGVRALQGPSAAATDGTQGGHVFAALGNSSSMESWSSSSSSSSGLPSCEVDPVLSTHERIIGDVSAWVCFVCYFFGRVPQIVLNYQRKATEGLSFMMFFFAALANVFYGTSIVIMPMDPHSSTFWESTLPYILGSYGCILPSVVVLWQFFHYRKGARDSRDSTTIVTTTIE